MQTISSFKPHGYKTLSNSHGIEIMVNDSGEEVSYRYSDDLPGDLVTSTEILFDQEGDAYFRDYHLDNSSTVHYLNEFMKIQK
jgi:hypothetical protein